MDKSPKFLLPPPNFDKEPRGRAKPHFLTPSGMTLLPREKQPPRMYGPRGSTVPAKYLPQEVNKSNLTPLPSSPPPQRQYCEGCEMELQSAEDLRRHRAAHELCPVDGCQYRGHASVMDKHVTTLHSTGLFDKFKKLSTPEEIAAWREERRKKFPSVANVKMRQAAQEQRQRRGERLEGKTSRFGKRDDRQRLRKGNETPKSVDGAEENKPELSPATKTEMPPPQRGKNEKRANKRRNRSQARQESKPKQAEEKLPTVPVTEEETCGGVYMFRGTSKLKDYKHAKSKKTEIATNALAGLLGMYGSEDEDSTNEEDEEKQVPTIKEEVHHTEIVVEKEIVENPKSVRENEQLSTDEITALEDELPTKNALENKLKEIVEIPISSKNDHESEETHENVNSDDAAPDEAPISHSSVSSEPIPKTIAVATSDDPTQKRSKTATEATKKPALRQVKRKSGLDYRKARVRKQNTMLEKLLEPDIRHERNVLLQCVRFVCENGFFGVGQSNTKPI